MKAVVQVLLLLLGLGFSMKALWMDWLWADIPSPSIEAGFNIKNYTGLEVLGEGGVGYLMTFYVIAILTSCIIKLGLVEEEQSQRIFKILFGVTLLTVAAVIILLITGSYLASNHVFYVPKTGLLLWIVANLLTMRWLWNYFQPPILPSPPQDILDDEIGY